ncbi:hypothetical protein [Helicobacter trogontum]|uniref:hypothetical protein n=1 Tax=Helicobacter trogontum TaxID=50960 RepID=UPI000AC5CC24|nr:hypothetical protein [Helicobacter trogontum]MCI5786050.1 hypothetical protein [Helicobacter trogontum]MDY5185372.1 hypothetical protein [Helicobacter trogontum]
MNRTIFLILGIFLFCGCAKQNMSDKDFNAIFSKESHWQSLNQEHIIKELDNE